MYVEHQFVNPHVFFSIDLDNPANLRNAFRLVIDLGAVGAGSTTIAHGLTIGLTWQFTRIYGVVNNTTTGNYYPIPWASAAGTTNIELRIDNTNVVITNNSGLVFTTCYVILEWLKN